MIKDEHLIPPIVKDLGEKIADRRASLSEKFYTASRLEAIRAYCEERLVYYNNRK